MSSPDLLAIAHRGMALSPPPILRHQKNARQMVRDGVVYRRQDYPDPGFNFVSVLGPSPPMAQIVAVADEFFAGLPIGAYGILVHADAGHPVEAELRAAGWRIAEDEPALVLPKIPDTIDVPPALEIRRVTDSPGLRAQVAAMAAAFDTPPEAVEKMMADDTLLDDPDIITLAGYCDGKVVCGATCIRVENIATVHGVATLREYRHRRFGRTLTLAAAQEGVRLGCTSAALRASGASFEMYRRMGFIHVCNHRTYARPTQKSVPIVNASRST
jgi:ribosomal protein S18 acetylase RimI-like enzyme